MAEACVSTGYHSKPQLVGLLSLWRCSLKLVQLLDQAAVLVPKFLNQHPEVFVHLLSCLNSDCT